MMDLPQRKGLEHNELLEFYHQEHISYICCVSLDSHKPCTISLVQKAKAEKESYLKNRLPELYNQGEKASQALDEVRMQQRQARETATRNMGFQRSKFLGYVYTSTCAAVLMQPFYADDPMNVINPPPTSSGSYVSGRSSHANIALSTPVLMLM